MIQFKRGKTSTWKSQTDVLADGQPGYDKEKNKLKIGDGSSTWANLPDASGLRMEEILLSEEDANDRKKGLLTPIKLLQMMLGFVDRPIITYGTKVPDEDTIGQVYLQYYDNTPEVDYVIAEGVNSGWLYRKWNSGRAECWITKSYKTDVKNKFEGIELYSDNKTMGQLTYPITFSSTPSETATVQSSSGLAWLASRKANSATQSGAYSIISSDSLDDASYRISIQVKGSWK